MRKTKKAIGYVCDIPIPGTGEYIAKEEQRMRIMKFAQKEGLELAFIYEDDLFSEDFMNRPGVRKIFETEAVDMVIVERVWCLTRKKRLLDPFLKELDRRGAQLVTSSYLWDCLSQQVRHRYAGSLAEKARRQIKARAEARNLKVVA